MHIEHISVADALRRLDSVTPFALLDVRDPPDFAAWKVETTGDNAVINVPYADLAIDPQRALEKIPRDRPLAVICARGQTSQVASMLLSSLGIDAPSVDGGMMAYGSYLDPVRVHLAPEDEQRFEIWQLNRRGKGCLSYVVRAGDEAVVVDPSRDVEAYRGFVSELGARIVRVLDTHVHADHVSGAPRLAASEGVPYFVAAGDGFDLVQDVTPLDDGEVLKLGGEHGVGIATRIISSPGHTPGSTSYLVGGRYLLSGDTLFVSGVGRPDLGGQVVAWGKALFHTLHERFTSLADDTVVLPAHYASPTEIDRTGVVEASLGELRRTAPELAIDDEDEFVELMRAAVREPPTTYQQIIRMNLGLAAYDASRAADWELGKNECAASKAAVRASAA